MIIHRTMTTAVAVALAASCVAQTSQPAPAGEMDDAGGLPVITIETPGNAPQRPLRLAPRGGTRQAFDVLVTREGLDDGASPEAPPMTWSFSSMAAAPEGGRITSEFQCTAVKVDETAEIPPEVLDGMRRSVQTLVGVRGIAVLSDTGVALSAQVATPDNLEPMLVPYLIGISNMVRQLSTPLPHEPVGVGATWVATSTEMIEGLLVEQTVRYTLVESDGTRLKMKVRLSQKAEPQDIQIMGTPARIDAFSNEGEGTIVRRLDQLFPEQIDMSLLNDVTVSVAPDGIAQQIRQRMRQTTKLTTRN